MKKTDKEKFMKKFKCYGVAGILLALLFIIFTICAALVDVAAELGIPLMRLDIAYKFLGNETSKSPKKIIDIIAPYIRRLVDYAKKKGVKVCSENHGRIMQDSYRVEDLM